MNEYWFRKLLIVTAILAFTSSVALASIEVDEEEVIFRLGGIEAERVFLVGDFNGWNPTLDGMISRGDIFEIRLFLLPGRYRYKFSVDGKSIVDPDNPWRDDDGSTYFIFKEIDGSYEITFEGSIEGGEHIEAQNYSPGIEVYPEFGSEINMLRIFPSIDGRIGDRVDAVFKAGFCVDIEEFEEIDSYPFSFRAAYRGDKGSLISFSRVDIPGVGDPLSIFSGPVSFGLEAGSFTRGIDFSGRIGKYLKGRVFYADRLEGGLSGLEGPHGLTAGSVVPDSTGFISRNPVDSDVIGLSAGYESKRFKSVYLFRHDEGGGRFAISHESEEDPIAGIESVDIHGIWMRMIPSDEIMLESEYLRGSTSLSSWDDTLSGGPGIGTGECFDLDEGHRFYGGLTIESPRLGILASVLHESVNRDLRFSDDITGFTHVSLDMGIGFRPGILSFDIGFSDHSFSGGYVHQSRMRKYDFWLDGDNFDPLDIPFLYSEGYRDLTIRISQEDGDETLCPYSVDGVAIVKIRSDKYDDNKVIELRLRKGLDLFNGFSAHIDLRRVVYYGNLWDGRPDFLNSWVGFRKRLRNDSWISVGAGLTPFSFDRWTSTYTGFGREKYLLESLFPLGDEMSGESEIARHLIRAENDLEEEWTISIQAGIIF
ncbi:MAG: glycogen-binding domain-containing protein [Bacteroidales bacterium]|nr:glycogen-binding domain-containing protein [Candidatus Latescibacterota bacterium]